VQGVNIVYLSKMLGHSSVTVTLTVYAHLLDREQHAERMRDGMEAAFGGNALEATGGHTRQPSGAADGSNVAFSTDQAQVATDGDPRARLGD
jgi:hypothetical protein